MSEFSMQQESPADLPLAGIKVLDLSAYLSLIHILV